MGGSKVTTKFRVSPVMTASIPLHIKLFWILHGFCKADDKMRWTKIQEKWSIWEILRENESFRKLQSDKLGYLSSQPRYVLLRYPEFFARCSLRKISTAATPYCSLHLPPAAVANVPTSISLRIWLCLNFARLLQGRSWNAVIQNSRKMNAFMRQVQALAPR